MADAITIKALQDASLDAKSLEDVVNGDEAKQVTTRKGETYPSVKKAIKTLFENGGLPATPYLTYSEMMAVASPNGEYAVVINGLENGLYARVGGQWILSDYSQNYAKFAQSILDIKNYIKTIDNQDNLLNIVDSNDISVMAIDIAGEVSLVGLDDTLQSLLQKLSNTQAELVRNLSGISATSSDALLTLVDSNDVAFLEIGIDGGIVSALTGVSYDQKIDEAVRDIKLTNKAYNTGYHKDIFNQYPYAASVQILLDAATKKYGAIAPVPKNMLGANYTIGDAWLDTIKVDMSDPNNLMPISGIDYKFRSSVGVVHPYTVEFADRVAGYKYWMAITGYTGGDDRLENVFIYGTNNPELKDWRLIEGFPTPFLEAPKDGLLGSISVENAKSHHSDVGICYDPTNGDIVVYWRVSLYYATEAHYKQGVYGCRYDGNGWSEPYFIYEPAFAEGGEQLLSPAIIHNPNDNMFYMFYVTASNLFYRKASTLLGGGWTNRDWTNINLNGIFWHLEVKTIGNKMVLLIHADDNMSGGGSDAFYFATSTDGKNWSISNNPINGLNKRGLYKSSFLPHINGSDISDVDFHIVYTTDGSTDPVFQLGVAKTNKINLGL